ncbi:MAG: hypothetical protein IK083_02605 [Abditibacteriota bacterium]|nr:hypothetical protein [Abditibacteriota bacterium]
MKHIIIALLLLAAAPLWAAAPQVIYRYTLNDDGTQRAYDEALAVACVQGIVNRDKPVLWVTARNDKNADVWQQIMTEDGRWLSGAEWVDLTPAQGGKDPLTELVLRAGKKIKGAVIWDPAVPATVNVATTIAGVEDLVVLSPEFAEQYLPKWKLKVKRDLRGKFDGSETGSAKNDAYRWAIREYLDKGKCSRDFIFLNTDAWNQRSGGVMSWVCVRDWDVMNRGFVYDLSPWGDEAPGDDPDQPLGTDLETYRLMLAAQARQTNGKQMTEVAGFFDFAKYSNAGYGSKHPVGTEWETVYLITPYNCYQNTADHNCYNKSFHSKFTFTDLQQKADKRPKAQLEEKVYLCVLMADYDSATPLYVFLPKYWQDPRRGEVPLSWGINPNLINTYPDVISYYYETATKNDYFVADATCAGYFNPTRVLPENMPLFIRHNQRYYKALDMDISPMVLDVMTATDLVKDAFARFSPRGYGALVGDWHGTGARNPEPQVWKGMPITDLSNVSDAAGIASLIKKGKPGEAAFYYLRIVWEAPGPVIDRLDEVKKLCPGYDIEIVDPYTFFELRKQDLIRKGMDLK